MLRRYALVVAFWLAVATAPAGAQVHPLGDLDPTSWDGAAIYVHEMANLGNRLFLSASDPVNGIELWTSDGTSEGTHLIRDIAPDPDLSLPSGFVAAGGLLFFNACDALHGCEPWRSDGTPAGTYLLKDTAPVVDYEGPHELTRVGERAFFVVTSLPEESVRLWVSDGTREGTLVLRDFGSLDLTLPWIFGLTACGDTLYFTVNSPSGSHSFTLWKSDGTPGGTVPVKEIVGAGENYSNFPPDQFVSLDGTLYFVTYHRDRGTLLWRSDGTETGTAVVRGISRSPDSYPFLTAVGDRLFFVAGDAADGDQGLWRSDGTEAGTSLLKAFPRSPWGGTPALHLVSCNGRLFFTGDDGVHGFELWTSDGTEAGTVMVKDISPGADEAFPNDFHPVGMTLFFVANHSELWQTDGTTEGTRRVGSRPGLPPFLLRLAPGLAPTSEALYFLAMVGEDYRSELWTCRPGSDGAEPVKRFGPTASGSGPHGAVSFGGTVFFAATEPITGEELWRTGGTTGTTRLAADVEPGEAGSSPAGLTVAGTRLFFTAGTTSAVLPVREFGLWCLDAPDDAPRQVTGAGQLELYPPEQLTAAGELVVYVVSRDRLWRSDGTAGGTFELLATNGRPIQGLMRLGDRVAFWLVESSVPCPCTAELWVTDGTAAGTQAVRDLSSPGHAVDPQPHPLAAAGATLYFALTDAEHGEELWRSDGTPSGTALVKDIVPGPVGSALGWGVEVGGTLYFAADDGIHGIELWRSDGTEAGTVLVGDLGPGPAGSRPGAGLAVGDRLFFRADDGTHGFELWSSDGSAAGTRLVADIDPGPGDSRPSSLHLAHGRLLFAASTPESGEELWESTPPWLGARLVPDLEPGEGSSAPRDLVDVGELVTFSATTTSHGREPWSYVPSRLRPRLRALAGRPGPE